MLIVVKTIIQYKMGFVNFITKNKIKILLTLFALLDELIVFFT